MTPKDVPMSELERALLREVISCGHVRHWDFRYPIEDDDAWKALLAAAIAYARPIVAEECARIHDAAASVARSNGNAIAWQFHENAAAAIREYGRSR